MGREGFRNDKVFLLNKLYDFAYLICFYVKRKGTTSSGTKFLIMNSCIMGSLLITQSFERRKNSDLSLKMSHNFGLPGLIRTGFKFSLLSLADAKLPLLKNHSKKISLGELLPIQKWSFATPCFSSKNRNTACLLSHLEFLLSG